MHQTGDVSLKDLTIAEKITELKRICDPLGISVRKTKQKDRYYITFLFDGSSDWPNKWGGFWSFAKSQIHPFFPQAELTSCTQLKAVFYIGSFMDFIKQNSVDN